MLLHTSWRLATAFKQNKKKNKYNINDTVQYSYTENTRQVKDDIFNLFY